MISEQILDMDVDHLGYIWVMTSSNLYFLNEQGFSRAPKFERADSSFVRFKKNGEYLFAKSKYDTFSMYDSGSISKIANAKDIGKGDIFQWEFTSERNLYRVHNSKKEKIKIAPEFQLLKHPITFDEKAKLVLDPNRSVWLFGTNGLLLYKKEKRALKAITVPNIIKQITAVRPQPEKNRIIYLTSFSGVIIQDESGEIIKQIPIPEKYRRLPAYDWFFTQNKVIIWAGFGVFELDLDTYQLDLIFDPKFIEGKKIEQTFCSFVTLSPDSTYLVLGAKGNLFYTYDLHTKSLSTYEIEPGIKDNSNLIFELDYLAANKAIITTVKGVYLFDKEEGVVEKMPYLQEKLIRSGAERIQDIDVVSDSLVYFATLDKGLYIYDIHKDSIYEPINNLKDVLRLTNFVVDDAGDAWFGSSKGILHYRQSMNRLNLYDTKNGLYTDDFYTNICHFDMGKIFFGHGLKYVSFDPNEIRKNFEAKLQIQSIYVNEKPYSSIDPILDSGSIELDYSNNNVTIAIGGSNYGTTHQFQVETRMLGLTDEWTFSSEPENIEYLSLKSGKYRFQYKPLGQSDATAKELSIHIQQPFWTRTWVKYAAGGLGFLLLLGLYFYNIWMVKKRAYLQAEYERKIAKIQMNALRARMNPHFIFNSLNSIKSFIIENDTRSATRYLTKFAHLIRQILNNSKASKISLFDELKSLELYIEIEKLRFNDSFSYEIRNEAKTDLNELTIPSMILQPIVENAIWHGLLHKDGEKNILITIKDEENYLIATIEDNGVGRVKAEKMKSQTVIKDKSLGTDITLQRLNLVDKNGRTGDIEIIDLYDHADNPTGTLVILRIPMSTINSEYGLN